jgi:cytochrome oxidase Cu insertion factor (SCO1/SenC/PrrC family)
MPVSPPVIASPPAVPQSGSPRPSAYAEASASEPGSGAAFTPAEPVPGEAGPLLTRAARASRFFTGAGLLVFLFTALAAYEAFLLFTLLWPTDAVWLGGFVRDFQLWCYRADSRTGGMSWTAISVMLLEPLFIVAVAIVLWRRTVATLRHVATWRAHASSAVAAATAIAASIAGLVAYARVDAARAEALPPFPGEAIRVALPLPDVPLVDQKGATFRFGDLRGQVVLVTGVYAACSTACPAIFEEVHQLLGEFTPAERASLRVVALSLNPEYETRELMDGVATARGFTHPEFRYVNGETPAAMLDLLSHLQFARVRNPDTGLIDHVNLFLVVDRAGRIAYRFNLDPRHRPWLRAALRSLLHENVPATTPAR